MTSTQSPIDSNVPYSTGTQTPTPATPSPTASSSSAPKPLAVGISLGVIALLLISIAIFTRVRPLMRKRLTQQRSNGIRTLLASERSRFGPDEEESVGNAGRSSISPPRVREAVMVDKNHPASRITPFGLPPDGHSLNGEGTLEGFTPRFHHDPGASMRIALRRPDGAWHFTNPRDSFRPAGVSDLDVVPASASMLTPTTTTATTTLISEPWASRNLAKEQEVILSREQLKGYGYTSHGPGREETESVLEQPPPAYPRTPRSQEGF